MKERDIGMKEKSKKMCHRCFKPTDEYRTQDGEVLCEKCIKELEGNARRIKNAR